MALHHNLVSKSHNGNVLQLYDEAHHELQKVPDW